MPVSDTDPGGLGAALSGLSAAVAAVVIALGHALDWDSEVITTVAALIIAVGNVGIIFFVRAKSWPPQAVRQVIKESGGTVPPELAVNPPPPEENG